MAQERRQHLRIDSHNLVYLIVQDGDEIIQQGMGRTLNVSQAGIRLETSFVIQPGQTIWLTVGFMEDTVDIQGEMIYYHDNNTKHDYGIRFQDIDSHSQDVLNTYIRNFNQKKTKPETDL